MMSLSRFIHPVAVVVLLALPLEAGEFSGTDNTPPTIQIISPSRGAFLSGPPQTVVEAVVSDSQSGIAAVAVNGQRVLLTQDRFRINVSLGFGANVFEVRASDDAGNVAHTSWAAMYSETYRPENQFIENGVAIRIGQDALSHLTDRIADHLELDGVKLARPAVQGHLGSQGIELELTSLHVSGSDFTAKSLFAKALVEITVANGTFIGTARQGTASLTGFRSKETLQGIVEGALALAIQTELPPALDTALNEITQPASRGSGVVVATKPRSVAVAPRDLRLYLDALAISPRPVPHPAPGSVSRLGDSSTPPRFETPHDFSLSLREDLINQTLFAAWQSQQRILIDQASLADLGITLPFPLDASFLLPFFPALEPLTGGAPVPIALEFQAALPPVAEVTGAPSLLKVELGEIHLTIQIDLGQGFVDLLGVVIHMEMGADVKLTGHDLRVILGPPTSVSASLLSNPLGLSQADIDQFLALGIPMVAGAVTTLIPAIPLGLPLPKLVNPPSVSIAQDSEAPDYVTLDLK